MISSHLPSGLSSVLAISTCLLASAPGIVYAKGAEEPATRVVRFADLDLNTRAGVQVLYRRIHNAAREVCGPEQLPGMGVRSVAWQDCVTDTVKNAVRAVDRPLLTAYHDERTGRGTEARRILISAPTG